MARRSGAKVLGEDLVVFRDTDGRVGVMDEYCPHRRASRWCSAATRMAACAALYHGWKMDVEGNVIEMVSEPAASVMSQRSSTPPTRCRNGAASYGRTLVRWTLCPSSGRPTGRRSPMPASPSPKVILPCNWAQILEGAIDSAHSSSLHSSDMVPAR